MGSVDVQVGVWWKGISKNASFKITAGKGRNLPRKRGQDTAQLNIVSNQNTKDDARD